MRRRTRPERTSDDVVVCGWRIDASLLTMRIRSSGPARDCGGVCCRNGAYVSLAEQARILKHARTIQSLMDADQTKDVERWFESRRKADTDFPGGVCVGTRVRRGSCVFLNREKRCTVQLAERALGSRREPRLKPFYCSLFPLTTSGRRLEFDDLCDGLRPCCTPDARGATACVAAYASEFTLALGRPGYAQVRAAARAQRRRTRAAKRARGARASVRSMRQREEAALVVDPTSR